MSVHVDLAALGLGLVADTGLKATVTLLAGASIATALRPASATSRHAVWSCTLASIPVLGALTWFTRGADVALSASPWWAVIWAAGALLSLLPLAGGLLRLMAVRTRGTPGEGVVWTEEIAVPVTFLRTVLMPIGARAWSDEEKQAAVLHERAHLRRGDWWIHVAAWLCCSILWFHPLAWWARRQLMLEAERAADDQVLDAGVRPSSYARQLVTLSRGPTAGLAMGHSATGIRVRAILGSPRRGSRRWPAALGTLALLGATALPLGSWGAWAPAPPVHDCVPGDLP
jgi:hypothetical protein